ncbi:hypothetical protein Godav_009971, partial [Gossypium davidsonii]|nr:hypothetical protein [Gossypium davidsonii]
MTRDVYQLYLDERVKIKQVLRSSCSRCLFNWGIDNLFTITVDNPSSNDVSIGAIRYVIQSPVRLKKFKECVVVEKRECKKMLGEAWPRVDDCASVRNFKDFLEHFYEATLHIFDTSYVTSNNFFDELSEIDILLQDTQLNINVDFSVKTIKMKGTYDKYWGDIDKMNFLIFVACVLDPRQKIKYLAFALTEMSNSKKVCEMMQKLNEALYELFDEYKPSLHSTCSQSSVSTHVSLVNNTIFPTLSKMAKDVLAISVSTIASKFAFSTEGRVLDQYRSSLT